MAIKCPNCGYSNDDKMSFCSDCGEPLDTKVRLLMELEGKVKPIHYSGIRMSDEDPEDRPTSKPQTQTQPKRKSRYDDDDFEYIPLTPKQKERNKTLYKMLFWAVLAAAALSYYLFFLR